MENGRRLSSSGRRPAPVLALFLTVAVLAMVARLLCKFSGRLDEDSLESCAIIASGWAYCGSRWGS